MGMLKQVIASVIARRALGSAASPLTMALIALLASRALAGGKAGGAAAGGLAGLVGGFGLEQLVERFRRSGLGDIIESWIAKGDNKPIQPDQLQRAVGPDVIGELARRTGMPREELLARLSECLPEVVDKLTPQGRLPAKDEMEGWERADAEHAR
jgi:uncharacterized protein YidB (DUF937 family)